VLRGGGRELPAWNSPSDGRDCSGFPAPDTTAASQTVTRYVLNRPDPPQGATGERGSRGLGRIEADSGVRLL